MKEQDVTDALVDRFDGVDKFDLVQKILLVKKILELEAEVKDVHAEYQDLANQLTHALD